MLYLNILLALVILIGGVVVAICQRSWLGTLDSKKHRLYLMYPMVRVVLLRSGLESLLSRGNKSTAALAALNVNRKPEMEQKLYWYSRVSLVLLVFFSFNILSILSQLPQGKVNGMLEDNYILRPEPGEVSKKVDVKVSIAKEAYTKAWLQEGVTALDESSAEAKTPTKEVYQEELQLRIPTREYTEEELNVELEKATAYIIERVLGDNIASDCIQENLSFIKSIPGTTVKVDWLPRNYNLISGDGQVKNDNLAEEERVVTDVKAVLTCQDKKRVHLFTFTILPRQLTPREKIMKMLYQELERQASENSSSIRLPKELEGYRLDWKEKEEKQGTSLFVMGILLSVVLWLYGDRSLEKSLKNRKKQMLMDYPEIINKFNLLLNAGMTMKQAWSKIACDYEIKLKSDKRTKRYAYEEMLLTDHELKLGVPEINAYEQFGRRSGCLPYMKFGSLIAQNLKKGNKGLAELLQRDALEAFEDRKELAIRLGEEAGTKLLGPMMLMLMIVLIIIMVPAFISFGI